MFTSSIVDHQPPESPPVPRRVVPCSLAFHKNDPMALPAPEAYLSEPTLCLLRILIGIALGLLTVYRREMSCNREYQDAESPRGSGDVGTPWGGAARGRDAEKLLTKSASSSSLPALSHPSTTSPNHTRGDPTEELLESASTLFSGGPFLAVLLAIVDHLILTVFLTSLAGMWAVMIGWRGGEETVAGEEEEEKKKNQPGCESSNIQLQKVNSLPIVAWNAASDYFNDISSKLDTPKRNCVASNTISSAIGVVPTRSKSVDNLITTSNRELMNLIAKARGAYLDILLLPNENQIGIFSYLHPKDVLNYSCTSWRGRRMLDDSSAVQNVTPPEQNNHDSFYEKCHPSSERYTATLIWKALFQRDFAWILKDWEVGREALHRSMDSLMEEANSSSDERFIGTTESCSRKNSAMDHILSTIQYDSRSRRDVPQNFHCGVTSLKEFYFIFNETWLNYTIAGCNSVHKCLIGLHGHVFDISTFVEQHPGSTETLLLQAGRDATVFFETMGHSLGARRLALGHCAVVNASCLRWTSSSGEGRSHSNDRASYWGLVQPCSPELQRTKLTPGFIIPRKRSKPRTYGGLNRFRQQLNSEYDAELIKADRWGHTTLGLGNLFGGVQVYYDPICCRWRWWYTGLNFDAVYAESVE